MDDNESRAKPSANRRSKTRRKSTLIAGSSMRLRRFSSQRELSCLHGLRWLAQIPISSVCVLLDVGTQPASTSIYHLWKTFDLKQTCGGACGEIVAMKGKYWHELVSQTCQGHSCRV